MTSSLAVAAHGSSPHTAFARTEPVRRWPLVLSSTCFLVYAAVGIWLMGHGDFAIGDALVRSANSRVILFSRDPHLAALGMAWMPLPVLSQLPFQAILHPLGVAWWSGPVSTAAYGAGTVYVLCRMGLRFGAGTWSTALVVLPYALNPVVVFWCASGMGEASTFFFLAASTSLFLAWVDDPRPLTLGWVGVMLGLATLTRYEMLLFAMTFAAGAALLAPRGWRIRTAIVVMLPTVFGVLIWLGANQILLRDAFAWYHNLRGSGKPPEDASWLPAQRNIGTSIGFVLDRAVRLAPALLVVVPAVLVATRRRGLAAATVLAAMFTTPALTGYLLLSNNTYGNLRYFLTLVLAAVVLTLWVARQRGARWSLVVASSCVLLLVGAVTGAVTEMNPRYAGVESEYVAMRDMLGVAPVPGTADPGTDAARAVPTTRTLSTWRALARYLDSTTTAKDLIAADTSAVFPVLVFTDHLDRFLISEDRTFDLNLQLSRPVFDVVLLGPGRTGSDLALRTIVRTPTGAGTWEKVHEEAGLEVYRLNPAPSQAPTS